jgi:hypothetical protein
LAKPGAAVTRATPTCPVSWAKASAMKTAAASCRVWTISIPASMQASKTGMI